MCQLVDIGSIVFGLFDKIETKVVGIKINQKNLEWQLIDLSPLRPRTARRETDTGDEVDVRDENGFE